MTEVNPKLNSKTGGLAYSAAALCYILVSLLVSLAISAFKVEKWSTAYIYLSYLATPIALAVSIAIILSARKVNIKQVFPVKCKPKYYLIALMIAFGMFFSLNWVNGYFIDLIGRETSESTKKISEFITGLSGAEIIPAILVIAVLPAVFEEGLFRGVILNGCEQSVGSVRTIFIVGFCFSLFHGSVEQTIYQFVAGCLFAFVAIRSRSILPCMLMHFANNALVLILSVCLGVDANGDVIIGDTASITLIVLGAVSLIGAVIWLSFDKTELRKCEKGGVSNFFIYASVGIVILAVIWICSLFGVG